MSTKRNKIIEILKGVFEPLEGKDGPNLKRYLDKIKTEEGLKKFYKDLKAGKEQLYIYLPNMKNKTRMADIFKSAKFIGLAIEEYIYFVDRTTGKRYRSNFKYPVTRLPVRRVKQFVEEKRSLPEGDNKIDLLSGQVIKPDKGSSISLIEAQAIAGKGLENSLRELLKFRGGDISAYAEYASQLLENGSVDIEGLGKDSVPRSSVIASVYLTAMGIDNNIVKGSQMNG